MMTREEIATIDRECNEQHVTQTEYLDSHGMSKQQYYRWKRRYREEDEQAVGVKGFLPILPNAMPISSNSNKTRRGKQSRVQNQESYMMVEIHASNGAAIRIQGNMTAEHLREIIIAGNV